MNKNNYVIQELHRIQRKMQIEILYYTATKTVKILYLMQQNLTNCASNGFRIEEEHR